ncbi:MAG TPA: tail fiber domain-containing protein [Pyrinomonadaceae bacterium]|nr:tail fiber domain-containing protein [Pyrinomonadaceae bacterium]
MAILRATHPISFHLLDRDGNQVIGIFDGDKGQVSTLEITNKARRDLRLTKLAGATPSATNHHFELKFRADTLNATSKPALSDAGWLISDPTPSDGGVSLYLLSQDTVVVGSGTTTKLKLKGLNADSKGGSRGTRMELKWEQGPLEYVANGSGPEPLVAGHRVQHLEIVNERGQQHIPLHVAFVGTNQVLNNLTDNILTLRISNQLKEGNIQLIKEKDSEYATSIFILSFDASDKEKWTMGTVAGVRDYKIKAVAGGKEFTIVPSNQGQSPAWTLTTSDNITLGPGDFIEVTIKDVKTNYQPGLTNLHVQYKNIPGYWDGEFVTPIEKSPVFYSQNAVGIWTNDPRARLHVSGTLLVDSVAAVGSRGSLEVHSVASAGGRFKVATDGKVGIGTAEPQEKLHLMGTARVEGGDIFFKDNGEIRSYDDKHRIMFRRGENKLEFREHGDIIFSPGSTDGSEKAKAVMLSNGNVGIGTTSPRTHLEVKGGLRVEKSVSIGGSDAFEIDAPGVVGGRFKVEGGGSVGIGTPKPGAYINEGDYFKADKNGQILEVHSPGSESALVLSTGQNMHDAHLGGVYFTRTAGKKDAHREVAAIKCRQMFTSDMAGGYLQFFTKPASAGAGFDAPRMVIRENGYVGIGTNEPKKAALEVATSVTSLAKAYLYLNLIKVGREERELNLPHSIWAEKRIAAEEFNAFSDARLKDLNGRSDGVADLATLLGIEITDYSFKDVIGNGPGKHKKVIGQQVEKVFPQAVSRQTGCVPDIYQRAAIEDGWVALATDLKQGDRVKLITEKGASVHEVFEVAADKFRVGADSEGELEGDKVFVFGREVDDFLSVDYDAISMLNISATQQLKKEMDQDLKALRVENTELRAANDALSKRLQLLESKLETMVGLMSTAATARTATADTSRQNSGGVSN